MAYAGVTLFGAAIFAATIDSSGVVPPTDDQRFDLQTESQFSALADQPRPARQRPARQPIEDDPMPMGEFASDEELVSDPRGFDPTPSSGGASQIAPTSERPFLSEQGRAGEDEDFGGWGID